MKKNILLALLLLHISVFSQSYHNGNKDYHYDVGTFVGPSGYGNDGITIRTRIPKDHEHNVTVYIRGFDDMQTIGLQVSWEYNGKDIRNTSASSTGGWMPLIMLTTGVGDYIGISLCGYTNKPAFELIAFTDDPHNGGWFTDWEILNEHYSGQEVVCTNKFSEVWTNNLYSKTINSESGVFDRLSVGTTNLIAPFQVADNNRVYYVNRGLGESVTTIASFPSYILLHPYADNNSNEQLDDAYTFGRLSAICADNDKNVPINLEINSSSKARSNNRASLVDYNESVSLKLVTIGYRGVKYVAVQVNSDFYIRGFSFTGYAYNEKLELINSVIPHLPPRGLEGGITTYTPNEDIENPQDYPATAQDRINFKSPLKFQTLPNTNNDKVLSTDVNGNVQLITYNSFWKPHDNPSPYNYPNTIGFGGTVYIGANPTTTSLSESSYKLIVDGKIGAKKIRVTESGWADYVFHKDYKLMPLTELERYIANNKHLPEVPTSTEVASEGVDVGNTQTLLLKKIEELTLYIIEQNKKIENQNLQLQNQKQRLEIVRKELTKLNKKHK